MRRAQHVERDRLVPDLLGRARDPRAHRRVGVGEQIELPDRARAQTAGVVLGRQRSWRGAAVLGQRLVNNEEGWKRRRKPSIS